MNIPKFNKPLSSLIVCGTNAAPSSSIGTHRNSPSYDLLPTSTNQNQSPSQTMLPEQHVTTSAIPPHHTPFVDSATRALQLQNSAQAHPTHSKVAVWRAYVQNRALNSRRADVAPWRGEGATGVCCVIKYQWNSRFYCVSVLTPLNSSLKVEKYDAASWTRYSRSALVARHSSGLSFFKTSAVRKPYLTHLTNPPAKYWVKERRFSLDDILTLPCRRIADGMSIVDPGGNSMTSPRSKSTKCPPWVGS